MTRPTESASQVDVAPNVSQKEIEHTDTDAHTQTIPPENQQHPPPAAVFPLPSSDASEIVLPALCAVSDAFFNRCASNASVCVRMLVTSPFTDSSMFLFAFALVSIQPIKPWRAGGEEGGWGKGVRTPKHEPGALIKCGTRLRAPKRTCSLQNASSCSLLTTESGRSLLFARRMTGSGNPFGSVTLLSISRFH